MHQAGQGTSWGLLMVTLSAFAVAGCQMQKITSTPPAPKPQPAPAPSPAPGPAPEACSKDFPTRHRLFTLPPTAAPISKGSKGQPLQWAISHPVGKTITDLSIWRDIGEGWSSIGLRLLSANASGISVHLSKVAMPDNAEIWLCSPDGSTRRGPLRAGTEGELSAPVVPGAEAWLEVLTPTRSVPKTTLVLNEVYGGFR